MSGTIPYVAQGTLNRLRTSIVFASYSTLNITSSYMGKSFASVSFDDPFVDQIGTATGLVNSPAPWVMSTISVGILKTQALSAAFLTQIQANANVGGVTIYSDSASFPAISLVNASILQANPAAFDGTDATVAVQIRGVFYPNADGWSLSF